MKKLFIALASIVALLGVLVLSLPTILHKAGLHPEYHGATVELPGKRALVITTSHGVLAAPGETEGEPSGVAISELTHPYYTFLDGGMRVDVASVKGGEIPVEPSDPDVHDKNPRRRTLSQRPRAAGQGEKLAAYRPLCGPLPSTTSSSWRGGWGAAYDLGYSPVLAAEKISEGLLRAKNACHGRRLPRCSGFDQCRGIATKSC